MSCLCGIVMWEGAEPDSQWRVFVSMPAIRTLVLNVYFLSETENLSENLPDSSLCPKQFCRTAGHATD